MKAKNKNVSKEINKSTKTNNKSQIIQQSDLYEGPFSQYELREIFIAKCEDFKLKFDEKLYQKFLDRQKELSTSKVLRMESCGLGPAAANLIVDSVFRRPNMRVIYFSDNFLGDEGAYCFADLIYTSNSLISIDLSSNRMTDKGTSIIFTSLKTNKSVSFLSIGSKTSIGRNVIGPKTVKEISEMLKENKVISELNFSMTELNSINIVGFCPGLSQNKTLTHLNLSNNNIKSSGAISVLKSLCHSNIIELRMASNHITDDVSPYVSAFLAKNEHITLLDLSANDLGYRFMASLAGPSAMTCTLKELILSRNPIGGRGISEFGTYLAQNQNLRILTVNGCMIDAKGFIEFCGDLQRNESLEVLHIQHNPLTDEGVIKFSHSIKHNKTLKEIDLELVEMTDPASYQLFPALLDTNIEIVSVRNNLIHDGAFIQKAIQNNQKLMKLDIDYNDISYSLTKEISKIIQANNKRWKDNEKQRIKFELNHITSSDIELQEVRKEIKSLKDEINALKLEKNELEEYLKTSDDKRIKRINELEERNNFLAKEVSVLMDDCRNQKSEMNLKRSQVESDISQLSERLAREIETLKTEFKSVEISDGRLNRFSSQKVAEEEKLNKSYKDAKLRYLDMKSNLITAWQLAREAKEINQIDNDKITNDQEKKDEKLASKGKGKISKSKSGKISKKKTKAKIDQLDPNAPVDPKKQFDDSSNKTDDVLFTIPGNKVKV